MRFVPAIQTLKANRFEVSDRFLGRVVQALSFGKRRGRKLHKTIGLKTVSLSLRLTMENSSRVGEERGSIAELWVPMRIVSKQEGLFRTYHPCKRRWGLKIPSQDR